MDFEMFLKMENLAFNMQSANSTDRLSKELCSHFGIELY